VGTAHRTRCSDRCHLNGLAMVGGHPRYVTTLGETDEPADGRSNKARGGILRDAARGAAGVGRNEAEPRGPF
jgi:Domain of unknown function (DUF4915)